MTKTIDVTSDFITKSLEGKGWKNVATLHFGEKNYSYDRFSKDCKPDTESGFMFFEF